MKPTRRSSCAIMSPRRAKGDTVWVVAAWQGAQLPDEPSEVGRL
jgi:hypothetical protein